MNPSDPTSPGDAHAEALPEAALAEAPRDWQSWWQRETAKSFGRDRRPDPYAARRAEPRLFAFFWTVYLLFAVLGAVLWLARIPAAGPSAFSPAARTMLAVIAAGVVILWPMTRLSQLAPPRPVARAVAIDLFVMLGPAQMVIWPLVFLAGWSVAVVSAVAAQLAGWGALVGGVVALALVARSQTGALTGDSLKPGMAWMLVIVGVAVILPLIVRLAAVTTGWSPHWVGAFSPFAFGGSMLGQGFSGPTGSPSASRWAGIAALWAIAAGVWAVALTNEATGNRTERTRFV